MIDVNKELLEQIKKLTEENNILKHKFDYVDLENQKFKKYIEYEINNNSKLRSKNIELENQIKEFSNKIEALTEQNLLLLGELRELEIDKEEIEELSEASYNLLSSRNKELEIVNHKLIKELDYLNDYINDMEKYN